ncbi:MAG: TolB family protein [Dehalococcoidia bacterium]
MRAFVAVVMAFCAAAALSSCSDGKPPPAAPSSVVSTTDVSRGTPSAEPTRAIPSIPTPTSTAPPTYEPPVDYVFSTQGGIARALDRATQYRLAPDRNSIWIRGAGAWERQSFTGDVVERLATSAPALSFTTTGRVIAHDDGEVISPDGLSAAFARGNSDQREIFIRNLATGAERAVASGVNTNCQCDALIWRPMWSPSGRYLAWVDFGGLQPLRPYSLRIYDTRDGIESSYPRYVGAAWAPDADRLIYTLPIDHAQYRRGADDVRLLDLRTGSDTSIVVGEGGTFVTPTVITFVREIARDPKNLDSVESVVYDLATGSDIARGGWGPLFSFVEVGPRRFTVMTAPRDGVCKGVAVSPAPPGGACVAGVSGAWSPDGRSLVLTRDGDTAARWSIVLVDAASGAERVLARVPRSFCGWFNLSFSADGKYVVATVGGCPA